MSYRVLDKNDRTLGIYSSLPDAQLAMHTLKAAERAVDDVGVVVFRRWHRRTAAAQTKQLKPLNVLPGQLPFPGLAREPERLVRQSHPEKRR